MKKFYYIFSIIAAASVALVSCQPEEEPHQPGPKEVDGCYGVFFPSQEASGHHIYNPTQDPSLEITLSRTNTSGAITVPIEAKYSADVFTATEAVFADGQEETTFTVSFPNAQEGILYDAHFVITDNQYASIYSTNPIAFDFSLLRVEMKTFLNPETGEPAVFTLNEGWWGEVHEAHMDYYEVNGIRTCTFISNEEGGIWGDTVGATLQFTWYLEENNNEGHNFLEVQKQYFGFDYSDWGSKPEGDAVNPVYVYDYPWYWIERGYSWGDGSMKDSWLDEAKATGQVDGSYPVGYYDGNGGFYFNLRYYIPGLGAFSPPTYDFVAISDGFVRVDYSLEVEQAGVAEEGVVPIDIVAGSDVDQIVYNFIEGELTPTQTANAIAALDPKENETIEGVSGTYGFELPKTGKYVFVAASTDADGNVKEGTSCIVTYLAAGDEEEYAVSLHGGLASAEKYREANTDNTLEAFLYGDNLTDAKFALYALTDLVSNFTGCLENLMSLSSVKADVLEAINGEGYVALVNKLLPGTEYYMLAYACNGYAEETFLFGPASTSGDPLPIYKSYSVSDYDSDFCLSKDEYVGNWNYYGIDWYGDLGLREYLGKVKIAAGEEDALLVSGLSAGGIESAAGEGYCDTDDDTVEFLYDPNNEVMYVSTYWAAGYDSYDTAPFYFQQYASAAGSWYRATNFLAAIPVGDGYQAFVDVSGQGYEFNGWRFIAGDYVWTAFTEPLLVDPAKDDNGVAPASVDANIARAKNAMRESVREVGNAPMLNEKARMSEVIARFQEKYSVVNSYSNATVVEGAVCPVTNAEVKSVTRLGDVKASPKSKATLEAQPQR